MLGCSIARAIALRASFKFFPVFAPVLDVRDLEPPSLLLPVPVLLMLPLFCGEGDNFLGDGDLERAPTPRPPPIPSSAAAALMVARALGLMPPLPKPP